MTYSIYLGLKDSGYLVSIYGTTKFFGGVGLEVVYITSAHTPSGRTQSLTMRNIENVSLVIFSGKKIIN